MKHNDNDFFSPDDENNRYRSSNNNESWNNVYNSNNNRNYNSDFNSYNNVNKRTKPPVSAITILLGTAAGLLFVSLLIVVFSKLGFSSDSPSFESNGGDPNGPSIHITDKTGEEESNAFTEVFEKCSPSIVGIESYFKNSANPFEQGSIGWGSGIIFDKNGYILTNSHVVGDSKETVVKIITRDKKEYTNTVVVGCDHATDIAVIKVLDVSDFQPVEFGDSSKVKVGERAIAIGNPHGQEFQNSLTVGVISGLNRPLGSRNKFIQTDAPINGGNSGGALFNIKGQVIGINSVKISAQGVEGMGFAIPISDAKPIIDNLIHNGYVKNRPVLGITDPRAVSAVEAKKYNVPEGVIIGGIGSESSLPASNVRKNDIITKINGIEIKSVEAIWSEIDKHSVGDKVKLTIFRYGGGISQQSTTFDVDVTLVEEKPTKDQPTKKKNEGSYGFNID